MSGRIASGVLVSALIRRAAHEGGFATVLARGDADAGGITLVLRDRDCVSGVRELFTDLDGRRNLRDSGVDPNGLTGPGLTEWVARRRRSDPDLWVVELDIAAAERFAAETIAAN